MMRISIAPRRLIAAGLILAAPVLIAPLAWAEGGKPLTLSAALAAADAGNPDTRMAEADRDAALAERDIASSRTDTTLNFNGILRSGAQKPNMENFLPDNSVQLIARKTLYDFGRSSAAEEAAGYEVSARESEMVTAKERHRLDVMARFFDVLMADMQYTADNEIMSIRYVTFDHGRDNLAAGKISAVELSELESRFQDALLKRNASQQQQRITRALLANAMNHPGELPEDLEDPKLESNNRKLPEYTVLLPEMLANNPRIRAQQELLVASQKRIDSYKADRRPTLDAEVQASDFSRPALTRDNVSAGLILNWPIWQGIRNDSRIAREYALSNKSQAALDKLKMDMTQSFLETYLQIEQLQTVGRSSAQKRVEQNDLVLERSRGLYEMELRSDLGTSMADTVEAGLRARRNEYQLALAFARLEAMMGKPLVAEMIKKKQ